ncbi:MAG TPA: hypothetical protein VJB87_00370 [Candidatus Nanoarchaeia archaeon]|nr:hypothetical protein [Candidatus Nanoarchaeia archaeon]
MIVDCLDDVFDVEIPIVGYDHNFIVWASQVSENKYDVCVGVSPPVGRGGNRLNFSGRWFFPTTDYLDPFCLYEDVSREFCERFIARRRVDSQEAFLGYLQGYDRCHKLREMCFSDFIEGRHWERDRKTGRFCKASERVMVDGLPVRVCDYNKESVLRFPSVPDEDIVL